MASAMLDLSSLTDAERKAHNVAYFEQLVLAQPDPEAAARGLRALVVAAEIMKKREAVDAYTAVYGELKESVRNRFFPKARNVKGVLVFGQVNKSPQSPRDQAGIPWAEDAFIPHYCCLKPECGYMIGRCSTVLRHIRPVHYHAEKKHKGHKKSDFELLEDADVFLPFFASPTQEDWLQRLRNPSGSLPSLLGKRDILEIADQLKEAMNDIIANPTQVIPPPNEILHFLPASPTVSADRSPSAMTAAIPSPPVGPITGRTLGKRKATEDYNDVSDFEQPKRRRAVRRGAGTPEGASSSHTASAAVIDVPASASTAPPTSSAPTTPHLMYYGIPIDPILLQPENNGGAVLATPPAPLEPQFSNSGWNLNWRSPSPIVWDAEQIRKAARLADETQPFEMPHAVAVSQALPVNGASASNAIQGSLRDRSVPALSSASGDASSTALNVSNIDPALLGQPRPEENATGACNGSQWSVENKGTESD